MKFAAYLVTLFLSNQAHAFDTIPKYQTSLDQKSTSFTLSELDSEYSSHILNYSIPIQFEKSKNSIVMSIGSLSGKEFLIQQKLQVHKNLNEFVPFRFFWWQDGDREKDAEEFIWSLGYKPTKRLQINGIGNSFNNKARNDVGLEATYQTTEESYITLVYYKPDFQKNKRNLDTDRWGTSPQMFFLGYQNENLNLFIRHEPEYDSFFTDNSNTESLNKNTFGLTWAGEKHSLQIQYDLLEESLNSQTTDLQRILGRYYYHTDFKARLLHLGLAYFSWQFDRGQDFANFNDLVPNILWDYGTFSYGYDVTFRHSTGQKSMSEYANQDAIENRFIARWNAAKTEETLFALGLTFDLDNLEDEPWEGGEANLRIDF